MRKIYNMMNNRKGFTLIELIIVIAIIGIIAAIAVPKFNSVQADAREKADNATLNAIERAIAVGVANGDLKDGTVIGTAGTDGKITFSGTAAGDTAPATAKITAAMTKLLGDNVQLKDSGNFGDSFTWTVDADGAITRS